MSRKKKAAKPSMSHKPRAMLMELRAMNAPSLAKHIRECFKGQANVMEGKDVLLDRAVRHYHVQGYPLEGAEGWEEQHDEDAAYKRALAEQAEKAESARAERETQAQGSGAWNSPAPHDPPVDDLVPEAQADPTPEERPADSGMDSLAGALGDMIRKASNPAERKEPPRPLDPFERREAGLRVTKPGNFPEAVRWPILRDYRRERDDNDFVWFRNMQSGRRVMLGKIVELSAQEHYRGALDASVNGLSIAVPRDIRVGIPDPHFEVVRLACDAGPKYSRAHEEPTGMGDAPPAPPPPEILRRGTYHMQAYGDCLCDPSALMKGGDPRKSVVAALTQLVPAMPSFEPQPMPVTWQQ
jgi:hypothetical protein